MSRPPRLKQFTYVGLHSYFLTSCTYQRQRWFEDAKHVDLVLSQILRTSLEQDVAVDAYCIMPDHLPSPALHGGPLTAGTAGQICLKSMSPGTDELFTRGAKSSTLLAPEDA